MVDAPNVIVGPQIFNGHFPARRRDESPRRDTTATRTRAPVASTSAGDDIGRITFVRNRTSRFDAFAIEKATAHGTRFARIVCRGRPRRRWWRRRREGCGRHNHGRRRRRQRSGRRLRRRGGNEKGRRRRRRRFHRGAGRNEYGLRGRLRRCGCTDRSLGARGFRRRFRLNRRRRRLAARGEREAETNNCATHAPILPQMQALANQISTSSPNVVNARACPVSPRCPAKARTMNRRRRRPRSCLRWCRTSFAAASNWHTR